MKLEKKLENIFKYFTSKKAKSLEKAISKNEQLVFEYTEADKIKIIEELTKHAIETNLSVFDSWVSMSNKELQQTDLTGAKYWIKKNYELMNGSQDSVQLDKIKYDRLNTQIKAIDDTLKVKAGERPSEITMGKLREEAAQGRNSEKIRKILDDLEHGKYNKTDVKNLKTWYNRRNELIARNEQGNIYATETKELMEKNNIDSFVWRTMLDARVRPEHAEMEGNIYKVNEVEFMPGEDFGCRCSAEFIK